MVSWAQFRGHQLHGQLAGQRGGGRFAVHGGMLAGLRTCMGCQGQTDVISHPLGSSTSHGMFEEQRQFNKSSPQTFQWELWLI